MKMMRIIKTAFIGLTLITSMIAQESTYLAQKLMLENDLRSRIESALQKIMDDHRYVLDVTVGLKFTPTVTEEVTFRPAGADDAKSAVRSGREKSARSVPVTSESSEPRSRMTGIPIPGFDFQSMEDEEPVVESVVDENVEEEVEVREGPSKGSEILSQSYKDTKASVPVIERLEVSCILPEGSAPELIENVRQIIMVASHFDRSRGDVLSVMTASFRQRKDERTAESIILRSIAEKIDNLEEQQADAEAQVAEDWRMELDSWKSEARRREEERAVWRAELDRLENDRITREFENERESLLERDSLRMNQLTQEIFQLKDLLAGPQLSEEEQVATEQAVMSKEEEKAALDSLIEEKLAMLELAQREMDSMGGGMSNLPIYLMSAISLLAVLALAAVILFNGRSKPKYVMPPPWMMQPPPKKKMNNSNGESKTPAATKPVAAAPATAPAFQDDPGVLQSEVSKTRESVVSMSVGDPDVATSVVQDWLEQEAPPPPEEPAAPAPAPEAEEDDGKKKKKKKK